MPKAKVTPEPKNKAPQANMIDLAIQPKEAKYERRVEDMGNGITRSTYYAVKEK